MADPRSLEPAVIFAVASLASLMAWELDHEVLSALFAAAAGVAFASPLSAQPRSTGADMDKDYLTLKRASTSRSSDQWSEDDCAPTSADHIAAEGGLTRRSQHRSLSSI